MGITVRDVTADDVARLDAAMPAGNAHAAHHERARSGAQAHLIAEADGVVVGSCVVRWDGFGRPEESAALPGVPEIAQLQVAERVRGQGFGTALLRAAEDRVAARGIPVVGLGVGVENPRARALYERLGYVDVHVRSTVTYRWTDAAGVEHDATETDALLARSLPGPGTGQQVAAGTPVLSSVAWSDPDAAALRTAQQDELRVRSTLLHVEGATGDAVNGDPAEADATVGNRVVATVLVSVAGEPVGTVAVCELSDAATASVRESLGSARAAEVKRLYVVPAARRQGLSRLLMARATDLARSAGFAALVLETGRLQPEAIALYGALGFEPIASYPPYVGDPTSLSLARRIDVATEPPLASAAGERVSS